MESSIEKNKDYTLSVRAMDYQGNFSELGTTVRNGLVEEKISVYPNPATNWLDIKIPWETAIISGYNACGNLLKMDAVFSSGRLDISDFESGVYIININYQNTTVCRRIVKM